MEKRAVVDTNSHLDGLLVFLEGLLVDLRSLIEGGLEVLNVLSELAQQVVTFAGISGP
jgi:hypothetical protein